MRQCSFCNRPENEVKRLVSTDTAAICDRCIKGVLSAVGDQAAADEPEKEERELLSPKEILAYLDQHVIGQPRAKSDLAVAVYNHYKRREAMKRGLVEDPDLAGVEILKSNILLLGPSGTGKTELARAISRMLGVPFYVADATRMTQAGYVGDDVESMLQGLIGDAGGDIERAEWGIVFIDEGDKLARKSGRNASGYRDVTGEGVQQALLKLVEGSKVRVPRSNLKADMGQGTDILDTTNVLFIFAGSFAGIEEIVTRRINKGSRMGFGGETSRKDLDLTEIYAAAREEDILEFGLIPELLGRLPVQTTTLPLTEDQMVQILTEPKNAIVKQFRALFAMDSIDLQFEIEALKAIGREAKKRPTGARALRSIIEDLLRPCVMEYVGDATVKSIRITEGVVARRDQALVVRAPAPAKPPARQAVA